MMEKILPDTEMTSPSREMISATDRISGLPDDLLLHVMFFLPLQDSVQTCLLSRRWKSVWAYLMWLHFDAAKFSSMKAFKKFTDNLLLYRDSLPVSVPLDAFWISAVCDKSDDFLDYSDIHPWIQHALNSNAWAVGVLKHSGPRPLSIEGYPFPFISAHLKMLALDHFSVDDSFVKNLSSCCPLLDDLELTSCAINITMFCSSKLKSLVITSTDIDRDYPKNFQHLVIFMPNLVSLRLEEIPRRNIYLVDMSSLETVSIYLFSLSFENSHTKCNILSSLSNATTVQLISPSVFEDVVPKVLQRDILNCGTFRNLKHLHLGEWFLIHGCYPLICLLRRSPGIEKLVLQLDKSGADDYDNHVMFPNADALIDPPSDETQTMFSCEKLRKIRIYYSPPSDKRVHIIMRILSAHLSPLPGIKIKPIEH